MATAHDFAFIHNFTLGIKHPCPFLVAGHIVMGTLKNWGLMAAKLTLKAFSRDIKICTLYWACDADCKAGTNELCQGSWVTHLAWGCKAKQAPVNFWHRF
jgi:hypothetical protein